MRHFTCGYATQYQAAGKIEGGESTIQRFLIEKKKKIQRFEKFFLDRFNKQITTILTYCGAVEELSKQIYIN